MCALARGCVRAFGNAFCKYMRGMMCTTRADIINEEIAGVVPIGVGDEREGASARTECTNKSEWLCGGRRSGGVRAK